MLSVGSVLLLLAVRSLAVQKMLLHHTFLDMMLMLESPYHTCYLKFEKLFGLITVVVAPERQMFDSLTVMPHRHETTSHFSQDLICMDACSVPVYIHPLKPPAKTHTHTQGSKIRAPVLLPCLAWGTTYHTSTRHEQHTN